MNLVSPTAIFVVMELKIVGKVSILRLKSFGGRCLPVLYNKWGKFAK